MSDRFIPVFDFKTVFLYPWQNDAEGYIWIVLMGFLVTLTCGLVGKFIVVRRMALVGDAIAHSLLPGIALAFLITTSRMASVMVLGAIIAGIFTTVLVELIYKNSRIKSDAALGIVFSALFALGVILITVFADHVDLDADCVLYGEIGFIPFEVPVQIAGLPLAPIPVVQMAVVALFVVLMIVLFYKELLVTSFDAGLAKSLGINVKAFHYGLMIVLSITVVSAFESVGAILVIAMLIFPGVTAALFSDRLSVILWLVGLFAALYALGGLHLSIWLDCSIAGAMVVMAVFIFVIAWIFSPRRGLLRQLFKKCPNAIMPRLSRGFREV